MSRGEPARRRLRGPLICVGHDHPSAVRPVSDWVIGEELSRLARAAGFRKHDIQWRMHPPLDEEHRKNPRRYAQVVIDENVFEFSRAILWLPLRFREGLMAHEIGHLLCPARHTEADADRAAEEALGMRIEYSEAWPGKGLQCVTARRYGQGWMELGRP